ncbi:hypothetical protein quinque_012596 [Culex quinquefasciatus]
MRNCWLYPKLIVKYGYKVEDHTVITEDGYVLKVFQMPPRQRSCIKKKPVLLVHGLLSSSADYVFGGPKSSLAYLLADNCYDVWLANMRGSRYSREHLRLPVQSKEYWDFSWHEMGQYDLPAIIDLVLNATNFNKLFYVGHSQGVTEYFVMASVRPEYNNKIALMTGLSPAVAASGGRFQRFNYGRKGNLEKYGSPDPPAYNLTASTAPVLIYYGLNDWMVHPKDVQKFSTMLPNLIAAIPVADQNFNHMDFVLAKNVRKVLYDKMLLMLDKYN